MSFASLAPVYPSSLDGGWLQLEVTSDGKDSAWEQLAAHTDDGKAPLWAGHRMLPAAVRDFGAVYVVSARGVQRLPHFARAGAVAGMYLVEFRTKGIKPPLLVMRGAPAARARLRGAAEPKPIKASHPMAKRMRELLEGAEGIDAATLRGLGNYQLQVIAGTFADANRVVSVMADMPGGPDEAAELGVVFTIDEHDALRQVVLPVVSPTTVFALGDLDGDGYDDLVTGSRSYFEQSYDVVRVGADAVESINVQSFYE